MLSGRDIRALLSDAEFHQIENRNSQMLFLRRFVVDKCIVSTNNKMPADAYDISIGNAKKIRCVVARRREAEIDRVGRPPALASEQEAEIVDRLLHHAPEKKFVTKDELLHEAEERYGKILTSGWANRFVARNHDTIADGKVYPQENPRREALREFLDRYLAMVRNEIVGHNSHLVFNRDETGTADWKGRKPFDPIVPAAYRYERIHFLVQQRVKHQTMLVCINTACDALCLLIATADRATLGVFRDEIEENADLQIQVGRSTYVTRSMFHSVMPDVLIRNIHLYRGSHGLFDAPAVLLTGNCMTHLGEKYCNCCRQTT
jgi:hypothetical protein